MQLKIWAPQLTDLAPWSCTVEVDGLFSPAKPLYGEDSWQAMQLAIGFVATTLRDFETRGGELYWPGPDRQRYMVQDLVPRPF